MKKQEKPLYSLIPLEDFKALLGVDDREDKTARFCLVTSTLSIEQHCKRRFLRKKYAELITCTGDLFLPLREYPVVTMKKEQIKVNSGKVLDSRFYRVFPDFGTDENLPFWIELSPVIRNIRGLKFISVSYSAGYRAGNVPADLASACLELTVWNMNRYRGQQIGMTGNVRKEGEHFELSMPANAKALLEPYRRKVI